MSLTSEAGVSQYIGKEMGHLDASEQAMLAQLALNTGVIAITPGESYTPRNERSRVVSQLGSIAAFSVD